MANDLNEEEAVVTSATPAFLGATVAFTPIMKLGFPNSHISLMSIEMSIERIVSIANLTHEKYLNKKIEMYDEIAIMVGKDVARESGAKSFDDVEIKSHGVVNLEEKGDGDDESVKENDKQSTLSVQLESRKSRKRACDDDLKLQNISTQMVEVAVTLQKISKFKLDVDLLYKK
ncbi:hypothetical protein Cgig2_019780 [Carnegiea gigantea]|uniref:Uncharacterized protein n=1 Tax=Carnegiea gigantea TaxID=171969 RepID=A0A9Q1QHF7_9CARY|nr:hypothetical protein Cgig2_019780 [Carnegiea gigantea]